MQENAWIHRLRLAKFAHFPFRRNDTLVTRDRKERVASPLRQLNQPAANTEAELRQCTLFNNSRVLRGFFVTGREGALFLKIPLYCVDSPTPRL
jgi:hypothetical protein